MNNLITTDMEQVTEIKLKKVRLTDIDQLQKIGRKTFYETFAEMNSEANMAMYLEEEFSAEKLTSELKDTNSEFYFATLGDTEIGYLKLNFGASQTELQNEKGIEIERIYVSKEFQGKKVGQLLYEKAVAIAKQHQSDFIWLGVWEENTRAIHFYKKNGFVAFDKHLFKLGDDEQTDIMMKLELSAPVSL